LTTFAIQNYGDCYSGSRAAETYYQEGEQLVFSDQNQPKPWLGCIDNEKKECHSNNLECGGQERTNYVYTIESSKCIELLSVPYFWDSLMEASLVVQNINQLKLSLPYSTTYGR
jgi:hypothetical protein